MCFLLPSPEENILILSLSSPRKLSSRPETPFIHSVHIFFLPQLPQPRPITTINDPAPSMNSDNLKHQHHQLSDLRAQAQIRNADCRPGGNSGGPESQSISRGASVCVSLGPSVCASVSLLPMLSMQKCRPQVTKSFQFSSKARSSNFIWILPTFQILCRSDKIYPWVRVGLETTSLQFPHH